MLIFVIDQTNKNLVCLFVHKVDLWWFKVEVDVEGENDGWFYWRMEVKQGATKEFDLQEVYRVKKGKNEFIGKFKVSSNMGDQEKIKIDLEIWRENDGIKRFRKQQLKIIQKQINEIVKNYEDD